MTNDFLLAEKYHSLMMRGFFVSILFIVLSYFLGMATADRWREADEAMVIEPREAGEENLYIYKATVERVVDADTVDCKVDLGFDVAIAIRFRLAGLNAPELKTAAGELAKQRMESLCPVGSTVFVDTIKDRKEKYGRYLGYFVTKEGLNVNQLLLDEGHAVRYP